MDVLRGFYCNLGVPPLRWKGLPTKRKAIFIPEAFPPLNPGSALPTKPKITPSGISLTPYTIEETSSKESKAT